MTEAERRRAFESTVLSALEALRDVVLRSATRPDRKRIDREIERLRNLVVKGEPT